jgi:MSHA biogenesis protein MshM
MQVVLFGQPELNERLKHNSVRQLRQRISFQYDLKGLRKDEVDRYLRHRLLVAGYQGETLFNQGTIALLHRVTRGTPRLINIIAHKALLLAYGQGKQQVTTSHVRRAVADTPEASKDWMVWVWAGLATFMLILFALIIGWLQ